MSNQQKELRLQVQRVDSPEEATDLRTKRNQLFHSIKWKLKENIEKEIDRRVSEIENTQDSSKKSKAVKIVNRKKASNPIVVHGKDGQPLLNTPDMYHEMKEHFEHHFYDKNHQTIDTFEGEKQSLNLPISLEGVEIAIQELNNNQAPGLDAIAAELVK